MLGVIIVQIETRGDVFDQLIACQLAVTVGVRQYVAELVGQFGAELGRFVGRQPLGDRRQHFVGGAAAVGFESVG
jgi:hypothetical protein